MPSTQYMELRNPDKNQKKFWEITAPYSSLRRGKNEPTFSGYKVLCRWGRIGTKGQSKPFYFRELRDADAFVDNKLREKEREGYTTISRGAVPPLTGEEDTRYVPIAGAVCECCGDRATTDWGLQYASLIDPPARLCRGCWRTEANHVRSKIEHNRRTGELGDRLPLKAQHPNPQDLPDDPFVIPD